MSTAWLRRREVVTLIGGGVACPFVARAQQSAKIPTIGVLWHAGSPEEEQPFFSALQKGFSDLGYVEGQNIRLAHRFPNEVPDRFSSMLAELVALSVDVIVSVAPASAHVRDAGNLTIPHVFALVPDPVGQNYVDSLARPGRNATGLSILAVGIVRKRFQLLRQALPEGSALGVLIDPAIAGNARAFTDETRAAAAESGSTLGVFEAPTIDAVGAAFDSMIAAGIRGAFVAASGFFYQQRASIGQLALAHCIPISVWAREAMAPDTFMSYGPSLAAIIRRAPIYVDKILKGAKPADLPVEQPTAFELIVNLKTAKACGIEVPQMLLAQADDVIE
jgi:putative ABC transport system substrate-binding protein